MSFIVNMGLFGSYDFGNKDSHQLDNILGFDYSLAKPSIMEKDPEMILKMNKPIKGHTAFLLTGRRGSWKTTHSIALCNYFDKLGYDTVLALSPADLRRCDMLVIEDIGKWFDARDFGTKVSKEFGKLLQFIRTEIPLVFATTPKEKGVDKRIREYFIPATILRKGTIMTPIFNLSVKAPDFEYFMEMKNKEHNTRSDEFDRIVDNIKVELSAKLGSKKK
ncbi:hypothetical protein MMJJ_06730 [Methanococcus maripaludis]|uniref:Uncharacterized protein n=2 Tax=Methanococcus maripaludis TaxID=39152 RepID=A0A2L1C9P7_METMI|nr:hypothetical protein MMJJ_06730 [Methanococcus maripaludis]